MDEKLLDLFDQWNNSACLGFVITALENLDYEPKRIKELLIELTELFDWLSVNNAEKLYCDSRYSKTCFFN